MRVAVVGHVEWIEFGRVDHVPPPGEIVHVSELWEEPGGGGAVAAVQLAKLAGGGTLYTALGDDELGHRAEAELERLGLRVEAGFRPEPQRRAFVHVDSDGERTITVIGSRLGPEGRDPLPWDELAGTDAIYFTAGDVEAVRAARAAKMLVSTTRGLATLREAGVQLDALVASARDPGERYESGELDPPPRYVIRTAGPRRRRVRDRRRAARLVEGDAPARTDQRPLRLRRQLRRRPHLRARSRPARSSRRSTWVPAAAPPARPDAAPSPVSCARSER